MRNPMKSISELRSEIEALQQTLRAREYATRYYVAASWSDRDNAQYFVHEMARMWGDTYYCTASWVFSDDDEEGITGDQLPTDAERFARQDMADIHAAKYLVLLTGDSDTAGKTFETGFAAALNKAIYPVGKRPARSVFRTVFEPLVTFRQFIDNPFPTRSD